MKVFLSEVQTGIVPDTWWEHGSAGNNQDSKKEMLDLLPGIEPFSTPKPEKLIQRILVIASNAGDLVLDSFLGSGTTCAVAHKMGRRYIGIEMGEHAVTHCVPRLKKVVDGEQGGISEAMKWQGGGGFRFYRLGEPVFDEEGKINRAISFSTLAAHVWFSETGTPLPRTPDSPWLGAHDATGYYLLYNGILGDKRPGGGNVLTRQFLATLQPFDSTWATSEPNGPTWNLPDGWTGKCVKPTSGKRSCWSSCVGRLPT
jgi:adenine-specific DNA-methyltransferase